MIYFDKKGRKGWWEAEKHVVAPAPAQPERYLFTSLSYLQSIQNDHDTSPQTQQTSTDLPYSDSIKASKIHHKSKRQKRPR